MAKYKFQIQNGNIGEGNTMIFIKAGIAEIEDITPSVALLIDAHGGQLVEEKPKRKSTKKKAGD